MKRLSLLLALASLASSISLFANADIIKPINQNSAIKITLPLAANEYYDFKMTLDGRVVKVGEQIPIDEPKCLDFKFEIKDLALSYNTQYCGQFVTGKTTEVLMPALNLTGPILKPDTLFAQQPHPFVFSSGRSRLAMNRLAHEFALPKLIPFLTNETTMLVDMPMRSVKIAMDPLKSMFTIENPSASRPEITFTRVSRAAYPNAKPLEVFMQRAGVYSSTFVTGLRNVFRIDQPVQVFSWLKMPWNTTDGLSICQVSTDRGTCPTIYQIGGIDPLGKTINSTYPTVVNINRIDIDDVTVNAVDGRVAIVQGNYTIHNVGLNFNVVTMAKTKTGMDVLPGEYAITVYYKDPFTAQSESKNYNLKFQ